MKPYERNRKKMKRKNTTKIKRPLYGLINETIIQKNPIDESKVKLMNGLNADALDAERGFIYVGNGYYEKRIQKKNRRTGKILHIKALFKQDPVTKKMVLVRRKEFKLRLHKVNIPEPDHLPSPPPKKRKGLKRRGKISKY